MKVTKDMLSPYAKGLSQRMLEHGLDVAGTPTEKLIGTLSNKTRYVEHYMNLKLYIEQGMKITKIHKVLRWRQSPWLQKYIAFNTLKRTNANTDFEKDLYKLMNNAVFGKTMENVRNRIRFVTCYNDDKKVNKYKTKNTFKDICEFNDNFVGIQLKTTRVLLNKPIAVGFAILALSKYHMYNFHYNHILPTYGRDNVKLLATDTDSLMYHITTNDVYDDFANHSTHYDTSEYPKNHRCFSLTNKKVIGKFKDETNGVPISEFVGLKAKMYAFQTVDPFNRKGDTIKKVAKGVKKSVINKTLYFDNYKEMLFEGTFMRNEMNLIRSNKHELQTVCVNKVSLSAYDDKRYILDDGISSLPYGHYRITG
jgi:hypothetical protein